MSLMVNPPAEGSAARKGLEAEKQAILLSLRKRAHMMTDGFNSLEGVTCNFTEGAMYSFPRLRLPPKAVAAAKASGKAPDVFYCLKLVEQTGISTVPGSGFGQEEGTYHLRTTILPSEEKMKEVVSLLQKCACLLCAELLTFALVPDAPSLSPRRLYERVPMNACLI